MSFNENVLALCEQDHLILFPDVYYHFEVVHAGECIAAGRTESDVMPLDDTLAVQRIMAQAIADLRGSA